MAFLECTARMCMHFSQMGIHIESRALIFRFAYLPQLAALFPSFHTFA